MRILILNAYYFPHMEGGAEFSVQILAENLANKGHEVAVLSMDGNPSDNISRPEIINGVKVYRSYSKSIYRRRIKKDKSHLSDKILNGLLSVYNPKMNRDVKKIIQLFNPNIIHTQNLVSMSYWIWKYAHKIGVPVVHTLRDYWLLDPTTNIGQSPTMLVIPFRIYHRYLSNKYVSVVTSPSNRTLEIFKDKGYFVNCEGIRIVNAISFSNEILKNSLSEKRQRKGKKVNFMYAGKLAENKGVKVLVEAFIKSNTDANLIMCGDGDLKNWIIEQNYCNIKLMGKLEQSQLFKEYKKADVLIVPSLWEEPFGRIVIEGAQYGLPIIGSDRGGIPEIIKELEFGSIYKADDVDALAELIGIYSNREYLDNIISNEPSNLVKYSADNQTEMFESVYIKELEK